MKKAIAVIILGLLWCNLLQAQELKKRGFKFVGSTIIYAHMQACGMVNDHLTSCFRYREVNDLFSNVWL